MDEIAWQFHLKQAEKAKEIHASLVGLYGKEMTDSQRRIRAMHDKVISDEENRILKDFALG